MLAFKSGDFIIQPGKYNEGVYKILEINKKQYRSKVINIHLNIESIIKLKKCRLATEEEISMAIIKRITK